MRAAIGVVAAALLTCLTTGSASAQSEVDLTRQCLDGDLTPDAVVARVQYGPTLIKLTCGSPISTGVLHIDDGHPIDSAAHFVACFRRLAVEGSEPAEDFVTGNFSRILNIDLGTTKAFLFHDGRGNVVTMYTSGLSSNNWHFCAHGRPLVGR